MASVDFYPLDISYKTTTEGSSVYLYGITTEGKQICVVNSFLPYFYVEARGEVRLLREEIERLEIEFRKKILKVIKTEEVEREIDNKKIKLIKVYVNNPAAKRQLAKKIYESGLKCFEYDILYIYQYLRDLEITPLALSTSEGDFIKEKNRVPVFLANKVEAKSGEMFQDLRIMAFDIETYAKSRAIVPEKNPVLMLAFYGLQKVKNKETGEIEETPFKKVITWKRFKTDVDYIEFVDSEEKLIRRFKEMLEKYKPDILTGYFSDGFDLPYLQKRAEVYKLKLDLGADYSNLMTKKGNQAVGKIVGMVHVDVFKFVRRIAGRGMETESYSLDAVANELLGHRKHDVNLDNLAKVWDSRPEELEEFCKYNLHDAYMTYELCVKLMPNMLELVKLVGLPLFDVNRMSFGRLVENYILKRSKESNLLATNKPGHSEIEWRRGQSYMGAFVYEPKPGVYENLAVFDFRSLYPTIIAAHNIGPDTLNCSCCEEMEKVPGKDYWFCRKKKSFFSRIVEDLISRRMRIKEMIKVKRQKKEDTALLEARSYGLKTVANSFYGYMGFFGARWYCLECVRSITAYARDYIKKTMAKAEEKGFQIIYGDTDSLMILLGDKSKEEAFTFMDEVNQTLPEFMELEFEGLNERGIFVAAKGGAYGAKKKYALYDGEKMKVIGFESIRRNWSKIAKETQDKVLKIVLMQNDVQKALEYVREIVSKLKKGEVEVDKLVIKTQLTRPIEAYESIGPHVAVAKRMIQKGYEVVPGTLISFVVGKGSGLVRERAKLVEELGEKDYDVDYYVKNQIIPAVNSIFLVLGYKEEDILKEREQKGLGEWF